MPIGDGIRRNVAKVSQAERDRLRDAILKLDTTEHYPDGVTKWDKEEEIHKNAHAAGQDVHGGPAFLPWHRELCNRFEALLRGVDPQLSLHYWDWTTDPRATPTGGGMLDLFTTQFMGNASGNAGPPLQNFESTEPGHAFVWRNVAPGAPGVSPDTTTVAAGNGGANATQFPTFRQALENDHNTAHGYIGGSLGNSHFSFHDPFVFLLHSDVDRLLARWQLDPGHGWRLDPNQVYGSDGSASSITGLLQPWAGDVGTGEAPLRPWAPPDNQQISKTCKHPSVVAPPLYDTNVNEQSNWRWCHKCQGLYFAGNPTPGHCPAGGPHDHAGSGDYHLIQNTANAPGQSNWRWCHKCQGLYFAGSPTPGHCPAGGPHDHTGSGSYFLVQNAPASFGQPAWRWCHKCQGLYFAGNPTPGHCPAGAGHDHTGSGDYHLVFG